MEELEWLSSGNPYRLLHLLIGRASDRKLRLFACACLRAVERRSEDARFREALRLGELYADGLVDRAECAVAVAAAERAARERGDGFRSNAWACIAVQPSLYLGQTAAAAAIDSALESVEDSGAERLCQCALLRDLFGNPFRPLRLNGAWLRWNDGAVRKLARALYDAGRFGDLPVLADALEEAGCDDADLLAHCRAGGDHVRGCWAVDLLLGQS
jgi:hypothetical protein